MLVEGYGLRVEVPSGWSGRVWRTPQSVDMPGRCFANVHLGNFDVPIDEANFGSIAIAQLRPGQVFAALVEFEPESAHSGWFKYDGLPTNISVDMLSEDYLRESRPGQVGLQFFCTVGHRPFSIHIVASLPVEPSSLQLLNGSFQSLSAGAVEWAR
jgi:hypothetical protein